MGLDCALGLVDRTLAEVGVEEGGEDFRLQVLEILAEQGSGGEGSVDEFMVREAVEQAMQERSEKKDLLIDARRKKRHADLMMAQVYLREHPLERQSVLAKLIGSLEERKTVEEQNTDEVGDLSMQQVNDMAVQFLFYFVENHPQLGLNDQLLLLNLLYGEMDFRQVKDYFSGIEEKDENSYGFAEDLQPRYAEIIRFLNEEAEDYFKTFLDKAKFDSNATRDLLRFKEDFFRRREKRLSYMKTAGIRDPFVTESSLLEAENFYQRAFWDLDMILMQRGNSTAANRLMLSLGGKFGKIVKRSVGRLKGGDEQDVRRAFREELVVKFLRQSSNFDLKKGRVTQYIWRGGY